MAARVIYSPIPGCPALHVPESPRIVARSADRQKKNTRSLTPFYIALGVVALIGVVVIASQTMGRGTPAMSPVAVDIDPSEVARAPGIAIGREDAPVVIFEFADFQCPGCAQFATFVAPLVKERLVEPGLVRYVYYDFPLPMHPHAFLASRAGRCANEQGRFWDYHDVVYARQPRWSAMRDATDYFVTMAEDIGLNRREFEGCLRSDRYAEEVTRNLRLGESLGVSGTPTLFINGRRLERIPNFRELEQLVMAEAGQGPRPGDTSPAGEAEAAAAPAAPPGT
jgi:protein-disulfide isomerase